MSQAGLQTSPDQVSAVPQISVPSFPVENANDTSDSTSPSSNSCIIGQSNSNTSTDCKAVTNLNVENADCSNVANRVGNEDGRSGYVTATLIPAAVSTADRARGGTSPRARGHADSAPNADG